MATVTTSTFNPPAASYDVAILVSLLNADSALVGFAQYYTTDGTTPTTGSTLYTAPIAVAATTTIKVLAVATGLSNSAVASGVFTITSPIDPTNLYDAVSRISTERLSPSLSGSSSTSHVSTEPH